MLNRKLCGHWTAGTYNPCADDILAYHYLVDGTGQIFKGKYKIEDNDNCYDGKYAMHCGGGNTGCIGIAMCSMAEFDLKNKKTKYPITPKQYESFCALAAYLSINYGIPNINTRIFTHAEFDKRKAKPEGKIDILYLPFAPQISASKIGNEFRKKVGWYRDQFKKGKKKFVKKGSHYEII